MVELLFLVALALVPSLLGWNLGRSKPNWSKRKVSIVSAIPLAGLMALVSLLMLGGAELTGQADCETDGCGTGVVVGLIFAAFAVIGFLGGVLIAFAGVHIARRGTAQNSITEPFE
jgi:hypothetical protein